MKEKTENKILTELIKIRTILEKQNQKPDWKLWLSVLALIGSQITLLSNLGQYVGVGSVILGIIFKYAKNSVPIGWRKATDFLAPVLIYGGSLIFIISIIDLNGLLNLLRTPFSLK